MVSAKELRKTLDQTAGKGESSRPTRSKSKGVPRPKEHVIPPASSETRGEERAPQVSEWAPPVVNIEEHEEGERVEGQLDTGWRREKRAKEDVVTPSKSNAGEQVGLNEGQIRRSGFLSSAVARDHIQMVMAEEDNSWMANKRHKEMFKLAFHNAYKIEKEVVQAFLKTDDFKQMVDVDSAEAYMIGFNKCLKVLRKYYPDLDQSVLSAMEPSSDEEEEEEEPVGHPEPLHVVLPSPHGTSKET